MSKATVIADQTLEDVAIQYCGSASAWLELARLNKLDPSTDLMAGQVLELPPVLDLKVSRFYSENKLVPAGANSYTGSINLPVQTVDTNVGQIDPTILVVQPGQTIEDIAIQYGGDYSAVFDLVKLNALDFSTDLIAGQVLKKPVVKNAKVQSVYASRGYVPAAGSEPVLEGIDYWRIEYEFTVQ